MKMMILFGGGKVLYADAFEIEIEDKTIAFASHASTWKRLQKQDIITAEIDDKTVYACWWDKEPEGEEEE